ncbi:MAG: LysR family transcriptional regulator [Solirubrobacteraceae bacterium]
MVSRSTARSSSCRVLVQLQSFLAIYRSGSVTAAAQRMHLSQPAVSGHLRSLETEFGRPLFVRLARGVSPTDQGHTLARDVAPHLDALESVQAGIYSPQAGATIHLGGPADLLGVAALPSLAPLVKQGIRVRVRTGIAEPLLDALAADELDLVLATRPNANRRLCFEPLFEESFVLVAGRSWRRRLDPTAIARNPAASLQDVPLVAFDEDLPIIRKYWHRCFALTLERSAALTVDDLRAVARAVAAGAGISVLPRYLAHDLLAQGELIELHRAEHEPTNHITLAYRPPALRRPGVDAVRRALLRAAPGWETPPPAG